MTKKWDKDEELDDKVHEIIDEWDDVDQELRLITIFHIIRKYARVKQIAYKETGEGFTKFFESIVPGSLNVNETVVPLEKMMDFWFFALENYGLDITIEEKNQFRVHKFSEKEFEIMGKIHELGHEEMFKQLRQARYPTIKDKKSFVDRDIQRQMDWMDRPENENLVRPEVVKEVRKVLEGYEDAPDIYRVARVFVYQAATKQDWDEAETERVLEDQIKEMAKDGRLSRKEYTKIKKITKRETNKKIA